MDEVEGVGCGVELEALLFAWQPERASRQHTRAETG
jgi:hypothetical protein